MASENVDEVIRPARTEAPTWPQREITHLALDAAGHRATATGADVLLAELVEDRVVHLPSAREVLRGERPPREAASGG